ncbi:peptidyl-prolyl cis-trans isomerase [Bradyrhizobium sp.]|uniref:peptidyl-prolyl cis-trans isomerase n=1 Tax=Bradyrhizobium sp. TaxID=376 RepID=UPI0026296095|nr:peptidyl-prolyl cis-trans isomerase [Bradyrhizobium sp.]
MLRGMRKASSNWLGKIIMGTVMGVLIVSFGIWGIADIFRGFGQSTLAKVGHTEISTEQFRRIFTDRLQQLGRQFHRPISNEQARALGIDRQVLQQTIAETTLDEEARRLGLGQSNEETLKTILDDPAFKGANGAFDPVRFEGLIRQLGYSEQGFLAEQRRILLRRQIAGSVAAGYQPPNVQLEALAHFQNEQRSIEYLKLSAAQAGTIDPPSPEALASYFEERKTLFRAPEYRKVSYVAVTPAEIGKWEDVSDADAKKVFEERRETLGTPERREVEQIVFPNKDDATAARNRIASGTSFEDIAKERGLSQSDIDLGFITKSQMGDPAIADAAFSLQSGEVSQPAQGKFGFALVKVGKIEPGVAPTYEAYASQIKQDIASERARAKIGELRDKMEDERGGGASVAEAAKKLGLKAVTIDAVDRSGRMPNGQLADIPHGLDLVSQAFNSDVGVDNDPISYDGGYVWYDVLGITPSRERSLDEVKDQVEARWRADQISSRLRDKANEMVKKLDSGGKLAEEATQMGLKVETAASFKRDASLPGLNAGVVAAAFRTAKDSAGQTPDPAENGWIVFRVTDVTVPPVDLASDEMKKLKDNLQRAEVDELLAQYVTKLESEIGTSINESAFAQATGASSGN